MPTRQALPLLTVARDRRTRRKQKQQSPNPSRPERAEEPALPKPKRQLHRDELRNRISQPQIWNLISIGTNYETHGPLRAVLSDRDIVIMNSPRNSSSGSISPSHDQETSSMKHWQTPAPHSTISMSVTRRDLKARPPTTRQASSSTTTRWPNG